MLKKEAHHVFVGTTGIDRIVVRNGQLMKSTTLMQPVHERGKIGAWIAPRRQGINGKPFDYDYVHLR
jgi:hypothetical protein